MDLLRKVSTNRDRMPALALSVRISMIINSPPGLGVCVRPRWLGTTDWPVHLRLTGSIRSRNNPN